MKRFILPLLLALGAVLARGAATELNVAEGTIESDDGLFVGRDFTIVDGFKLELLYVPSPGEGNWVALDWDNKGRLIVPSYNTDQLMRLTIPPVGSDAPVQVEMMTGTQVGAAEGILYAFDSIYLNVNRSNTIRGGLYRLTDTNGDDVYDTTRVLRNRQGDASDHGTHDLKLSPDGTRIFWLSGNATRLTEYNRSRVVPYWGEDNLVQRLITSAPGFNRAPEAQVMTVNEAGTDYELYAIGMRNPVTFDFNKDGELFLYDADHEPEFGFTSYRPTNVMHIMSGGDAGWRASSRVHPFYYFDNIGTIAIVGAGSPVGSIMGTGAKFPARFQDSYFISDWSFGNFYQVALTPNGASYKAEVLPFIFGRPFAVSGAIINPADGSMILQTTGTELYRVTYVGDEPTTPTQPDTRYAAVRDLRRSLEAFHGRQDPRAVETAWPYLGDADRAIRYAARTAIEWQDVATWRERALSEQEPRRAVAAIAALARVTGPDEYHYLDEQWGGRGLVRDQALESRMLATLNAIQTENLQYQDKLDLMRAYELVMIRLGRPSDADVQRLIARLDPMVPSKQRELNWELAELMVYLQAPTAAEKVMGLLRTAPTPPFYGIQEWINPQQRQRLDRGDVAGPNIGRTEAELAVQEDQLHYAELLRTLTAGWTPELRREYLTWYAEGTKTFTGGLGNLAILKADAVSQIPEAERAQYQDLIDLPLGTVAAAAAGRGGGGGGFGGGFGGGQQGTIGLGAGPGSLWVPGHRGSQVTDVELTRLTRFDETLGAELAAQTKAVSDLTAAAFASPANPAALQRAVEALAAADANLALKRADGWVALRSDLRIDNAERRDLMMRAMEARGGRGLGAGLGGFGGGGGGRGAAGAPGGAPAGAPGGGRGN